MGFLVHATGAQAIFQDRGRFGFADAGVSASGAFDRRSAERANHALGNDPAAAVLEILLGGFEFEAQSPATILFTGADAAVTVHAGSGRPKNATTGTIIDLDPGDRVRLEPPTRGLRSYLAVRGGFQVSRVLGSAATDVLSRLGPPAVRAGDVLPIAADIAEPAWWPPLRQLPSLWERLPVTELTVIRGPRDHWFTPESLDSFFTRVFTVSGDSNRIGLRLHAGRPLARARSGELPSEGMVRGAVQVPPDGDPVIFGPDHPVTGGYPVIAVLTAESCDRCAQLGPGDRVSFTLR